MATDPLQDLRLKLMNDALPLGLGALNRWRDHGTRDLLNQLRQGKPGFDTLQRDGEKSARQFRDTLDQVVPGLGNPVVKVSVSEVPEEDGKRSSSPDELQELQSRLQRIRERVAELKRALPAVEDSTR